MTHWITGVRRDGDIDLQSTPDGLELGFTEHYRVLADSKDIPMWEVMRDAVPRSDVADLLPVNGLPLPGVTIALDGICVCKTLRGDRSDLNPLVWEFTATWSSKADDSSNASGDPSTDPNLIVHSRETLFENVTRYRLKDIASRPYCNGAGNLFSPPLEVDDELIRWDFQQFEPAYIGTVTSVADTLSGLSGGTGTISSLTDVDMVTTPGTIYPPGYYRKTGGGWAFAAVNDFTVGYFNGCVNATPFLNYPAYTLLLKVRKSTEIQAFGALRRLSEYSIIYDPEKHWDKPLNAGPFFLAHQLDADGNPKLADDPVMYPYIYYQKDVETADMDLAIDNAGPIGKRNIELQYNSAAGKKAMEWPAYDWTQDGVATGGMNIVQTADGDWTVRAVRIDEPLQNAGDSQYSIEFMNHNLLNFNGYLRVR